MSDTFIRRDFAHHTAGNTPHQKSGSGFRISFFLVQGFVFRVLRLVSCLSGSQFRAHSLCFSCFVSRVRGGYAFMPNRDLVRCEKSESGFRKQAEGFGVAVSTSSFGYWYLDFGVRVSSFGRVHSNEDLVQEFGHQVQRPSFGFKCRMWGLWGAYEFIPTMI